MSVVPFADFPGTILAPRVFAPLFPAVIANDYVAAGALIGFSSSLFF